MSSSATVIRGGLVALPDGLGHTDVRIEGGRIASVALSGNHEQACVIDADGLWVLPGLIDAHTHFQLGAGEVTTLDDFEAGSRAAAAGGVTTCMNFAPPRPDGDMAAAVKDEQARANAHSYIDFGLHACIGTPQRDVGGELDAIIALGVTSIKAYTTYRGSPYFTDDWDLARILREAGPRGVLTMVHAENDTVVVRETQALIDAGKTSWRYHGVARPEVAETAAVATALAMARDCDAPLYLVHLTVPESVRLVTEARGRGVAAHPESCVHHLTLNDDVYAGPEAGRYIMTPPLRDESTRHGLVDLVVDGLVQTSGSDHCGYGLHQRDPGAGFAAVTAGIPGVETLWRVLYTELVRDRGMSLESVLPLVTSHPAAIFGLSGKGVIAVGADADVVLFDPESRTTLDERDLHSAAGYSPWHGRDVCGRIVRTISRGITVYDGESIVGEPGNGRFVRCAPYDVLRINAALDGGGRPTCVSS